MEIELWLRVCEKQGKERQKGGESLQIWLLFGRLLFNSGERASVLIFGKQWIGAIGDEEISAFSTENTWNGTSRSRKRIRQTLCPAPHSSTQSGKGFVFQKKERPLEDVRAFCSQRLSEFDTTEIWSLKFRIAGAGEIARR